VSANREDTICSIVYGADAPVHGPAGPPGPMASSTLNNSEEQVYQLPGAAASAAGAAASGKSPGRPVKSLTWTPR